MERFIMADDCALRIGDTAKGDITIVLLHGYLESLDVWDDFTKLLKQDFRVVVVDLPGHGISQVKGPIHTMEFEADVVRAVLVELGIEKCVMVGHSMGGYVALEFVRKYMQMLSGVVLLHSTPNADIEAKRDQRAREIEIVEAGKKDMLARILPEQGFAADNRKRLAESIEALADQVMLTEDEGVIALLRGMSERSDLNDMLAASAVPQMFVFGRKDEYITSDVAQSLIERHPKARIAWLENSGHMSMIEEPVSTAEIITDFVRSVSPVNESI